MAAHRYNPPPNWPPPPQGWTPPEDWEPDPAWGPAPEDWQFWVRDDGTSPGRRPNRGAWGRAAVPALVLCALLSVIPFAAGAGDPAVAVGEILGRGAVAYLVTAVWGFFSSRRWGWARYAGTVGAVTVLLAVIAQAGATGT